MYCTIQHASCSCKNTDQTSSCKPVTVYCLHFPRIYTLIHVVSYRSSEKDYKEKNEVSDPHN